MKTCQTCHQSKPLIEFYVNKTEADGYAASCRKCARAAGRSHSAEDEKFCPRCAKVLPLSAFHKNRRRHDGVQQYCKDCTRLYAGSYYRSMAHDLIVSKEYGLGRGQYAAMLEAQSGVCAICHGPERQKFEGKLKKLAVDHDHATGKARALLCHACNSIIGYADDNVERLEAAIEYLKNPP